MNKHITSRSFNGASAWLQTTALLATLLATALGNGHVLAQETILDNGDPSYNTTGTWNSSTAVTGFFGPDYDTRLPGPSPDALVVDNTSTAFSTLGTWTSSTVVPGYEGSDYQHHFANGESPAATVVDNLQGTTVGTWNNSTSTAGYYATDYQVSAAGNGTKTFDWALPVASAGNHNVYARWTAHSNRASNAAYTVNHSGGATLITANQQTNGSQWVLLGNFALDPGLNPSVSLSDDANGYVIADAVMAIPDGAPPNTATWALGVASADTYNVYARWTAHPNRATNAPYTVNHSGGSTQVLVDQQANGGQWQPLGSFMLDPGQNPTVSLTDQADGFVIADAIMVVPASAAPNSATWAVPAGTYEVYARWTANPNRATNAPYTVNHAGGNVTLTDEADGYVVADAIRLISLAPPQAQTYYIHADHLNSPRVITDANQAVVWRWDNKDPFGATIASDDPDGDGLKVTCNLRFPGQYFDQETNLHYNFFRDYNPETGRYVQSDPIGLEGGLNTYAYVVSNPLLHVDREGQKLTVGGVVAVLTVGVGGYYTWKKYARQRQCEIECEIECDSIVACGDADRTAAYADNYTRCLHTCKSNCVLSVWGGKPKKGPKGPQPPVKTPPYITDGTLQ